MVFSVVKNWLAPVFGSIITSLRSSQKLTEGTPKEIRTFGAGSNQSWRGRGPPSAYPITNVTFSESEERMVNEYKMQDLKPWGDPHGEPVDAGRSDGVQRSQSNRGKNTDIRKDVEVAITTEYVRDSGDELPQDYAYIKGTKRASSQIVSESK